MKVAESKISPQWSTTIPKEVRPWLKANPSDVIEWHVYQYDEMQPQLFKIEVVKKQ